jgi:SAM-dependent methyltransferase
MADLQHAAGFYQSPLGAVAASLLSDQLVALWPPAGMARLRVLGIGYTAPFLRCWQADADRCIALSPAQLGRPAGPPGGRSLACTAEEDALPFADLTFDRILLVHALEAAENDRRLLREAWRVLKDDGQLLAVAANRRGIWAHTDTTPFGHGRPYSSGQVSRLLQASMFRVERRVSALYVPCLQAAMVLRGARVAERIGPHVVPGLAGVTITEARKDLYAAVPALGVPARRRLMLVDAA